MLVFSQYTVHCCVVGGCIYNP